MDELEFNKLGKELQNLSKRIPLKWGMVQNDTTDRQINMFSIHNVCMLEEKIKNLPEKDQNYFRRRWFLWQCARVDEYLFYSIPTVIANPIAKDQAWDIEFNGSSNLRFDVKGTFVPKSMRDNFTIDDESKIIEYYYKNQSKGVRENYQNRLFIVHHSFYDEDRSMYLRCHWELKKIAYQKFAKQISEKTEFSKYQNVHSKCIFFLEDEFKMFSFQI
jgi:hypothetical protein